MTTLEKDTTDLQAEHCDCITAIDAALSQLEKALTGEKEFRRRCQCDHPEFHTNMPGLKFPIVLSTNKAKPFQFITEWRIWVRHCRLLRGGE